MADDEIPLPRGGYNFDNMDFDNPNFNPFATKSKVVVNFDDNAPLSLSQKPNTPEIRTDETINEKDSLKVNHPSQSPDENKNPNVPKNSSFKQRNKIRQKN